MKIRKLTKELRKSNKCIEILRNNETDIFSFHPYVATKEMVENMLYICDLEDIPYIECKHSYNFLCKVSNDKNTDHNEILELYPKCNFIFFLSTDGLEMIFEFVSKIMIREMMYTGHVKRLLEVFNRNKGLQSLVDELDSIIHSTIIIIDTSYRILAMSKNPNINDITDLKAQQEYGYLTEETLKRMKRDNIYDKLRLHGKNSLYTKAIDEKYYWYNALIYVHGIEIAEIGILDYTHTFNEYDFELFNFFRQLVAWEMEKENFYSPTKGFMHSIFLSELLEQKFLNQSSIERRMNMLGWKNTNYYNVLVAFTKDSTDFENKAEIFALQVQTILKNVHWVISNSHIIFLIGSDKDDITPYRPGSQLSYLFLHNHMRGVLSNGYKDLRETKKHYELTRSIQEFEYLNNAQNPIYYYAEYAIFHMAKLLSESHDLKDFYHPVSILLKEYDEKNNTLYSKTLHEYLIHVDNPSLCAKNLCIHKNTFFYRINRIRELFPISLDSGIERMHILLSLELMRLQ